MPEDASIESLADTSVDVDVTSAAVDPVAADPSAPVAPVAAVLPARIQPLPAGADGKVPDLFPPCGGSWRRDADGGLTPLDAATAQAAGLSFTEV